MCHLPVSLLCVLTPKLLLWQWCSIAETYLSEGGAPLFIHHYFLGNPADKSAVKDGYVAVINARLKVT